MYKSTYAHTAAISLGMLVGCKLDTETITSFDFDFTTSKLRVNLVTDTGFPCGFTIPVLDYFFNFEASNQLQQLNDVWLNAKARYSA